MSRQLRIDEDVQGFSDQQLAGLITIAEMFLRNGVPASENSLPREPVERMLEKYRAERERRALLA